MGELASNFSVAEMLDRDNFSKRYKEGKRISLQEFLYPIMQGYDSVAIAKKYGSCDLELGGNDQYFNLLAGRTLMHSFGLPKQDIMTFDLLVGTDGKKMSKSLGNFYKLKELIDKGFSAEQIRYLLLTTHYRTQLNFTFAGLEAAKHSIERLSAFIQRLLNINDDTHKEEESIYKILDTAFDDFTTALADDLNISAALAALFDMIREINTLCDENKVNRPIAQKVIELMKHLDTILGVMSFTRVEDEIPEALKEALTNRNLARKNKDWATSDELRDFIHSQGYSIEDTSTGARLKRSI